MTDYLVVCAAALLTSGLTLFSGFGLGTLLMPAFALFFPLDVAVALTAVVHLLNNLFKLALMGRHADRSVVLRFGLPAIVAALGGAALLVWLSDMSALWQYRFLGRDLSVAPVKLVIAVLMIGFALQELVPRFEQMQFGRKYLSLGGLLSGFFGGLSGHQGAMRSAFLVKCGLSKESFIGSGVAIACLVDMTRLTIYSAHFAVDGLRENTGILAAATLSAFLGAFIGVRLVRKVTMRTIQLLVALLLVLVALGLAAGLI